MSVCIRLYVLQPASKLPQQRRACVCLHVWKDTPISAFRPGKKHRPNMSADRQTPKLQQKRKHPQHLRMRAAPRSHAEVPRRGWGLHQITFGTIQTSAQAAHFTHRPGWWWNPPSFDLNDICACLCSIRRSLTINYNNKIRF